jgi:hypothetical protein
MPTIKEKQYLYGIFKLIKAYTKSFIDVVLEKIIAEENKVKTINKALKA